MSPWSRLFAAPLAPVIALLLSLPLLLVPTASAGGGTASISGTVTGSDGGGLRGIEVTVYLQDADFGPQAVESTRSDASGRYQLTALSASPAYRLDFKDAGGNYVGEYFRDEETIKTSIVVPVTDGATVSGIDAELTLAGHVRGTVTDSHGAGLVDVSVLAYQHLDGVTGWSQVMAVRTDASGRYALGGLAAEKTRIEFDRSGVGGLHAYVPEFYDNAGTLTTATDVSVTAGATTSLKSMQLATGGHITGTVTGRSGAPLTDIGVTAYKWNAANGDWEATVWTATGVDGGYDLNSRSGLDDPYGRSGDLPLPGVLSAGIYRVGFEDDRGAVYADEFYDNALTVEEATDISVTAGATMSGMDAELASTATPPVTPAPSPTAAPSTPAATPTATPPPTPGSSPTRLRVAALVGILLAATIAAIGIMGVIAIRRRRDRGAERQSTRPRG